MRPGFSDLVSMTLMLLLAAAACFLLTSTLSSPGPQPSPINLSDLAFAIKHSAISSIEIDGADGVAIDTLGIAHPFRLGATTSLLDALSAFGVSPDQLTAVNYSVSDPSAADAWWHALLALVPMILLGSLVLIAATAGPETSGQQLLRMSKHRGRRFLATGQLVCFADVAGVEDAKQELHELVQFLSAPARFATVGARCPRGVLLVGAPGTGKTLLARAVAGEAGVPFFSISGSEFVEIIAGVGASRVRDLFAHARRVAPCILFIDEIDAIGRRRGLGVAASNSEADQALNQLLVELDGFDSGSSIVVIAATNRVDILDPALLRPGRFDRHVILAPPDRAEREAILRVHARGKPLEPSVDLALVARETMGFSGADLAQIVNESAILAARRGKRRITPAEFDAAIERLLGGPEATSHVVPVAAKARRAYHEAGRALTIQFLDHHPPVHTVTIVPHLQSPGSTRYVEQDECSFRTSAQLRDELVAAMAGTAAERLVFSDAATGDEKDIAFATDLAEAMVKRYGMSRGLGPVALSCGKPRNYSDSTARLVDLEMRLLIDNAAAVASSILAQHRPQLDQLAAMLLEEGSVNGDDIRKLLTTVTG
jgi:cell division protease FtsH